jgi:Domain of unknown function (DUF1772)
MLFGVLALVIATGLAALAWGITLADHPARLDRPTEELLAAWRLGAAQRLQSGSQLTLSAGLFCALAGDLTGQAGFLGPASLLTLSAALARFWIEPLAARLRTASAGSATRRDLIRWGDLHAIRTVLLTGAMLWLSLALLNS